MVRFNLMLFRHSSSWWIFKILSFIISLLSKLASQEVSKESSSQNVQKSPVKERKKHTTCGARERNRPALRLSPSRHVAAHLYHARCPTGSLQFFRKNLIFTVFFTDNLPTLSTCQLPKPPPKKLPHPTHHTSRWLLKPSRVKVRKRNDEQNKQEKNDF